MKRMTTAIAFILSMLLVLSGCGTTDTTDSNTPITRNEIVSGIDLIDEQEQPTVTEADIELKAPTVDLSNIPAYSGKPYVEVNGNKPYFTESEMITSSFEKFSPLDNLGRCGVAYANVGKDLMPTEERGSIGMVKPTGWQTVKYDNVDGKYLYNRCHLLGFQLTGENANEQNLITGTRYMNMQGMLPFENMVADYVKETGNHTLYRVTPIFEGDNLLASGVLMEGYSVEDDGKDISFCVFCYNVQPDIEINYANGDSKAKETTPVVVAPKPQKEETPQAAQPTTSYIANKNTKKLHYPYCHSVDQMKESNKRYLNCTREEALSQGYVPCKRCNS